jgi:hypothetical protein
MSDENVGREASRSLVQGFAGCLGVGLAILLGLIVLLIVIGSIH